MVVASTVGQDDVDRQAGICSRRKAEGGPGRGRHVSCRGRRAVDDLGGADRGGNRHGHRAATRPAWPIVGGPAVERGRCVHRRHGRPPADAAEPDAAVGEDSPRHRQADSERPTRCCWFWTPRPARTESARPRDFPKPLVYRIVLAKLDGTAKGGVVIPIRQQFELPVKYVGVGERPKTWPCSTSTNSWRLCSGRPRCSTPVALSCQ